MSEKETEQNYMCSMADMVAKSAVCTKEEELINAKRFNIFGVAEMPKPKLFEGMLTSSGEHKRFTKI